MTPQIDQTCFHENRYQNHYRQKTNKCKIGIMEIYIVRHAIAEDAPSKGTGDAARALTEEGRQKMKEAAAGFAKLEFSIDKIFSSPLIRAKQTAEILAK